MKIKKDLVIEIIEDSYTIYDPIEDRLISLNLSASLIFEWILKNKEINDMIKEYAKIYEISQEKAKEDIYGVIEELKKEGVIVND